MCIFQSFELALKKQLFRTLSFYAESVLFDRPIVCGHSSFIGFFGLLFGSITSVGLIVPFDKENDYASGEQKYCTRDSERPGKVEN